MAFKKWRNQFIDLAQTKPTYLLSTEDNTLTEAQQNELSIRISAFPRYYVELGSGSGGHLIELAKADSQSLHVGVELRYKRAFRTAEKAEAANLQNLLVVRADALGLLPNLRTQSVSGFYINFPDPWAKARWHKHRLMSEETLTQMRAALKPDGFIAYKTDHLDYFRDTMRTVSSLGTFDIVAITENLGESEYRVENISTEFESLFRSQSKPIAYVRLANK